MNPFDALGDPVRRQILQLLSAGEQPAGEVVRTLQAGRTISQPAVSQHLRALRTAGLVQVRPQGTQRLYALDPRGIARVQEWLTALVDPAAEFAQPLDALATEVRRGRRDRRRAGRAHGEADSRLA